MGVYRFDNGEFVFQMDYSGKKTIWLLRAPDGRTVLMRGKELLINDTTLPPNVVRKEVQRIWADTTLETQVNHKRMLEGKPRKTPEVFSETRMRDAIKAVFRGVHDLRLEYSFSVEQSEKPLIVIRNGYESVVIRGKRMLLNTTTMPDDEVMVIIKTAMESGQRLDDLTAWLVSRIFSK